MKIFVKKHYDHRTMSTYLMAADPFSEERIKGSHSDVTYSIELKSKRHGKHHQKYWVILQIIFNNQEKYTSVDSMHGRIKVAVGYCDTVILDDNHTIYIPKSTSYEEMSQEEFDEHYDKVMDYISSHIVPGLSDEDLKKQVEEMIK